MKKLILFIACILISNLSFGQNSWDGPDDSISHISRKGEVTIGNNVTVGDDGVNALFHVKSIGTMLANFNHTSIESVSGIRVSRVPSFLADIETYGDLVCTETGFGIGVGGGGRNGTAAPLTSLNENDIDFFILRRTDEREGSYVGIGTITPDSKLTVNGRIHALEVLVDTDISPDYVFQKHFLGYSDLKPDYSMPTLEELEQFIKVNHHLPEVPSAQEFKENGMKLKEMTNLLLQKVEELTLYTIEQEKRIQALETKLNEKQ